MARMATPQPTGGPFPTRGDQREEKKSPDTEHVLLDVIILALQDSVDLASWKGPAGYLQS